MKLQEAYFRVLKKLGIVPEAWIYIRDSTKVNIVDCTFLGDSQACVKARV